MVPAKTNQNDDSLELNIEVLKNRIASLSKKLNKYIQMNGCSPQLKDKANSILCEVKKDEELKND